MNNHSTPTSVSNNDRTHLSTSTTEYPPMVKLVADAIPAFIERVGAIAAGVSLTIAADALLNTDETTDSYYVCRLSMHDISTACQISLSECHTAIGRLMESGCLQMVDGRYLLMRWQS